MRSYGKTLLFLLLLASVSESSTEAKALSSRCIEQRHKCEMAVREVDKCWGKGLLFFVRCGPVEDVVADICKNADRICTFEAETGEEGREPNCADYFETGIPNDNCNDGDAQVTPVSPKGESDISGTGKKK